MRVTSKTKYRDFQSVEEFMTDEGVTELYAAAEQAFKPCNMLTIDEFFGCVGGNFELLGDITDPSVLQVYWCKRFRNFCEEFKNACESLTIKDPTMDKYHKGTVTLEPQEGMLIFTREYFGLPSFFEAGKRTIGEYLLARKDKYNQAVVKKNQEAEFKQKTRKK